MTIEKFSNPVPLAKIYWFNFGLFLERVTVRKAEAIHIFVEGTASRGLLTNIQMLSVGVHPTKRLFQA